MRIGVEVGGTFTDLVLVDESGIRIEKVPSTPASPERGALAAIDATGATLEEVVDLVHGSTVATNAILERKGARVALFITAGFRDLLQLQRHSRGNIYDLFYRKPEPVVQRHDTFEIAERVDAQGEVVAPLDAEAARAIIRRALEGGDYDAAAVCLLNSFVNPDHEARLVQLLAELAPTLPVSASIHVNREFREYERCSTTALAAYVQPVIDGYLRRFDEQLRQRNYRGRFSIMQSNGGRLPADAMADNAITSLFSGPAAGVIGATRQVAESGFRNLITLDMGGTSTDVCLIEDGRPQLTGETAIDGLPIKTPVIDIATVGAGGGSLVWIDDGDLLRVGPASAGAIPGPACYGRGGTEPTITDAHVVRGTIRPESFLRGAMPLDVAAARAAFEPVAERLGIAVEEAAESAVQVAESNIVRAVQRISTERGKDPRDYVLVPFGGAGPMQAVRVAEELGIGTVVVPPHAGVLSAMGLVVSDFLHHETRTHRLRVTPEAMGEFAGVVRTLEASVRDYLSGLGLGSSIDLSLTLQMRYAHQAFEIPVDLDPSLADDMDAGQLRARFDGAHREIFGFAADHPCDIVSFRVGGAVPPQALPPVRTAPTDAEAPRSIEVHDQGRRESWRCQSRSSLSAEVDGPTLIEDGTSTILLPPGWRARPDPHENLIMTKRGDHR